MDYLRLLRCESLDEAIELIKTASIREEHKDAILLFVDELRMKGFSPFRIMAYIFTLLEFSKTVDKPYEKLTSMDLRQYVNHLLNRKGNKHSTVREKMMRIRVFLRWFLDLPPRSTPDAMRWFFTIKPKSTKGKKNLEILKKIVSYEEYSQLLSVARNPRDKALLQFMYESGARILEVLKVRIRDINIEEHYAVVGDGKRLVPLSRTEYIEGWLQVHPLKDVPDAFLFCNLRNPSKPLSYPAVRRLLRILAEKANIHRKITPHMFRHSRATILAKIGVSPYAMNQVMGWSASTKMWQIYLHITQKDAIQEVLRKIQVSTYNT